ncbi:type VI secretion system tip protein TssI/VgrG [Pseudomonas sp. GG8]
MPTLANQPDFSLTIARLKRDYNLQVLQFTGQEGLNQPFCFDIELVGDRPALDLNDYLHKSAFLSLGGKKGYGFHGLIHEFVQGQTHWKATHYHLKLVPQLFYLEHRTNQRIFQKKTVKQIIAQVLEEHGILSDRYRFELDARHYEPRNYCTQYKESDLYFVQRLCEEEGLSFRFEHSQNSHILVFADHQDRFNRLPESTVYVPDNGMNAETVAVKSFSVGIKGRTSRVTRRHYDFETSSRPLESASRGDDREAWDHFQELENFTYPAYFKTADHGRQVARKSLERLQLNACVARGASDQPMLLSGHLFALEDHPRKDWNTHWLLNHLTHRGRAPQVMEALNSTAPEAEDGFAQGYQNTFTATPEHVIYRPPLDHPKPVVLVSQTATVCGPKDEEIYCDEYGRVKVRFRWDRSGSTDELSSCWVRVVTGWAGSGYGSSVIPRVGMEVVIGYDEGDPDSPMLTGYLFNKANTVPYPLPANKTRSVFKSLSYPGGGGGNEVHIEDRKGKERIYLHAQRDFLTLARNDHTLEVDNEQHTTIKANAYSEYHAEEHHTTHGLRKTQLNADDSLNIAGSSYTQVAHAAVIRAGQDLHLQSGINVAIDAQGFLTLKGAGQHLVFTPAGIFSSSLITVGGAPIPGTPPAIQRPQLPGESAQEAAGRLMALSPSLPEFSWEHEPEPVEVLPEPAVCEECLQAAQDELEGFATR